MLPRNKPDINIAVLLEKCTDRISKDFNHRNSLRIIK